MLVTFGGLSGVTGDDVNKFLWMARAAERAFPAGGVTAASFMSDEDGQFRVDARASGAMLDSLLYALCYHRFGSVRADPARPAGWDRVRHAEIGRKDVTLEGLEEAFTSKHWIVRVYRVL